MNEIDALLYEDPNHPEVWKRNYNRHVIKEIGNKVKNHNNSNYVKITDSNINLSEELRILEDRLKNLGFFKSLSVKRRIKEIQEQMLKNIKLLQIDIIKNSVI